MARTNKKEKGVPPIPHKEREGKRRPEKNKGSESAVQLTAQAVKPAPAPTPPPLEPGQMVMLSFSHIQIPIADIDKYPTVTRIDISLSKKARQGLKRVTAGAIISGAQSDRGQLVTTAPQSVNWMLEQIADAKTAEA